MSTFMDQNMDWDSVLKDDGSDAFIILREGNYHFTVKKFTREYFNGSKKIPPCPKAVLTLCVISNEGEEVTVNTSLLLYRSLEWKISGFFRCIGQKKRGEDFTPDWDNLEGTTGYAHFKPRTYTAKDGTVKEANDVAYFIDKTETENENQIFRPRVDLNEEWE